MIVIAEDEEKAFASAEDLLQRQAIGLIEIDEIALLEKKRTNSGSGFVVEGTD
ncbi:hypothetical protein CIG75_15555 [Tumebacillus algifaecis]|uniref:DUF3906 domain-containing protein n=1 Tax=Tumebacillus algifaecis TaxID=1214604 RepID=A0A223D466_9BACL|nr:DUF3906 family protein [Tumebacillus algifaecis]ASS76216.1 hypothetical protein CIG75_15555 [Tumebacillus algifaecis]